MARNKNALREHFIAPLTGNTPPSNAAFLPLAHLIETISDSTDEETDTTGFYDGDGTPETTVISVARAYDVSGFFDPTDPAQLLIANMQLLTGEGRNVWHRVVSSNGSREWVGRATVTSIVAGSGDATDYEEFGCTITYNERPTETLTP